MLPDAAPPGSRPGGIGVVFSRKTHVAFAQIRHGRNAEKGRTVFIPDDADLFFSGASRHKGSHYRKELPWSAQKALRIMIPGSDDDLPEARLRRFREKAVVEALRVRGRHRRIEDVAGNEENVNGPGFNNPEKPLEKCSVVGRSVDVGQRFAEMPVRCVKNADGVLRHACFRS